MAAEHDELVAEIALAERMPIADRLKLAKKRRAQQLKVFAQYEKQLSKDASKRTKKNSTTDASVAANAKKAKGRLQFAGNILILDAAARNDVTDVRNLLNSGVSPDTSNEDGLTTLHQCCIDGLDEMMKLLLDHGANVNARDSERWTPLHAAATCGHVKLCKYLCDYGADLLAVNADGNMPYDLCEDADTLDYIESEMAKRGITQELIDETRQSTENMMLADLQNIANDGRSLEQRGPSSETSLHVAACNGYIAVLEFLLSRGASIDVVDKDDWQPLHCAVCWGQIPAVKLLLEHGADVHATTRNGETALDLCDDLEMRQAVLELIDEIQNNQPHDVHHPAQRRNSSVRRGSAGMLASHSLSRKASLQEKDTISAKDAREEAARFREMMSASAAVEEDEDSDEQVIDAVTLPSPTSQPVAKAAKKPTSPRNVNIWVEAGDQSSHPAAQEPEPISSSSPATSVTSDNVFSPLPKSATATAGEPNDGSANGLQAINNNNNNGRLSPQSSSLLVPPFTDSNWDGRRTSSGNLLDLKKQRAREREERMQDGRRSPANGIASAPLTGLQNGMATVTPSGADGPIFDDTRRRKFSNRYDIAVSEEDDANCCLLM